jgi:hypothetical protein
VKNIDKETNRLLFERLPPTRSVSSEKYAKYAKIRKKKERYNFHALI